MRNQNFELLQDLSILVVDDEPEIREIIAEAFEMLGCQTALAANGKEAIAYVMNNTVDLIVSDIRMPGGDGLFLLKYLRTVLFLKVPLILVTGYTDLSVDQLKEMGAAAVINKPFSAQRLIEVACSLPEICNRPRYKQAMKSEA